MSRTIWIVRHGQRIDNIDEKWKQNAPRGAWDDPHLTEKGMKQATEVGKSLENEKIDYIFCSPFLRCVQTTSQIFRKLKTSKPNIFIEQGFCESLSDCRSPPGFLPTNKLKEICHSINVDYDIFMKMLPNETNSLDCLSRIQATLEHVINKYKGNILIVSHGSPIAACNKVLSGEFKYVGQCTISKYQIEPREKETTTIDVNGNLELAEFEKDENANSNLHKRDICERNTSILHKEFKIKRIFAGDANHLSDRTNLRDVPKFIRQSGNLIALC